MKKNHTKRALASLLIPVAFAIITIALILIASILEKPMNRSGIYSFFALVGSIGVVCFPAVVLVCDVIGSIHSVLALKGGEIRWKNVLILIFAILSIAFAVTYTVRLWQGMMSV